MAAAHALYIATVPAVATALGLYLLDRTTSSPSGSHSHHFKSSPDLSFGKDRRIPAAAGIVKEEKKQTPKLAPQFDGLFCFETLVIAVLP
ncbi:hypothetical protein LINPERHAP2_LOCUS29191 [Linum perenne]